MILWRLIVRLIGVVFVSVLALAGLAIAAYCLDGAIKLGSLRPDRLLSLPTVRHRVGDFLTQMASPGPVAALSLLCGVGAVLLGLWLLVGVLRRPKERLALLESDGSAGDLDARPGVLREMLRALAEAPRQASAVARPKLSLARRGTGGRVTVVAKRSSTSEPEQVKQALEKAIAPLTEPFSLKQRIHVREGTKGERVR